MSEDREFFVARRRRPKVTGGLYIGTSSSIHGHPVKDRCKVPTPEGPCGHIFFENETDEAITGHVTDCLRRNHDTIMETMAKQHPEIMKPWDPELAGWVRKHARAILEGRKKI